MKKLLNALKSFILFNLKIFYSIFIGFVFMTIIFIIFLAGVKSYFSENVTINEDYSYLVFNLKAVTDDKFDNSLLFDDKNISFLDVITELEKVRLNDNVRAVILNLDEINASSSQIEELISIFKHFKLSGKKIYAYGTNIDAGLYRLASIADKIIMPNTYSASLDLTGYFSNSIYYKGLLDKFGVSIEAIHVGSHKSAGENLYLDKMSDELRADTTRLFDNRLNNLIETIATNRKLNKKEVEKNILNGDFASLSPYTARDYSLIDEISDFDTFMSNHMIHSIQIESFSNLLAKSSNSNKKIANNSIAVISLEGNIEKENGSFNSFSISRESVVAKLEKVRKINNLRAIVLRINSPGGSALESELIYKELMAFKKEYNIPIYVSMGSVAASGGYYIASASDKIFANNSTLTGSIGVVSLIPKFVNTVEKLNLSAQTISKGKFAGIYSPYYALTDEDRQHIYNISLNVYDEFKNRVKSARNLSEKQLEPIAGGRVWFGNEAVNIGLVDEIGGLNDTIKTLAKDLKINKYNIVEISNNRDISNIIQNTKKYIYSQNPLFSSKEYNDLMFFNNNATKPLYFGFGIEEYTY